MFETTQIRIRDPFIVPYKGKYYMYSSTWNGQGEYFSEKELTMIVYESIDMVHWEKPKIVFSYIPTEKSWIQDDLWAPEIHLYHDKFYAFLSFRNKNKIRGTYVAVSDSPFGMFSLLSERPVTPEDMSCIDGTLYVENDIPYVIYSHDWPDNYNAQTDCYVGEICARRLSLDLSVGEGKAFCLFASSDAPLSAIAPNTTLYEGKRCTRYGSDAPFVMKLENGNLFLTWSPMLDNNYVVLAAVSESGRLTGPWRHLSQPIFNNNGGHAMFFNDFKGQKKMCIHCPECMPQERALILDVEEKDGIINIKN